jgi:N-acetylneuraminic acid mutarotase
MRMCAVPILVLGACGSTSQPGDLAAVTEIAAAVPDPCAATGTWRTIAPLELRGRVDHTAVWTGTEMLLWGGTRGIRSPFADGARYEPATDRWLAMSQDQVPIERDDHVAIWTGTEMIVWGGNRYSERRDKLDSGGRYDPVADRWLSLPMSGLTARDDPRAVWTGSEMIVWGGRDSFDHTGDGARYSPSNDRWRAVSASGAPEPREDHTAIWTGSEMIVWGGWNGDDVSRNYALDGGRYDPRADRWRPISRQGAPDPREDHSAIWTGTEMIVWGGVRREPNRDDDETIESADDDAVVSESSGTRPDRRQLATGGRYDPATDTWTPITLTRAPEAREDGVVVWTGTDMLVWGGQQAGVPLASGARYVASADTWCAIDGDGAPAARRDHAGVWTGHELVMWGGRDPDGDYPASGAAFAP